MATYTLYANKSATAKRATPDTNYSTGDTLTYKAGETPFIGFDKGSISLKKITAMTISMYIVSSAFPSSGEILCINGINGVWNETTLTQNNKPEANSVAHNFAYGSVPTSGWLTGPITESIRKRTAENGVKFDDWLDPSCTVSVRSSRHANKPYLTVTAEVAPMTATNMRPNGFKNRRFEIAFSWVPTNPYASTTIGTVTQASAKLRYRVSGATSYAEIAIAGNTTSYALAPNTLTYAAHEWQIEITTNDGVVSTSAWQPFTTIDSVPGKPMPIDPTNTYLNGAVNNLFVWEHVIDTGSPQSRADLQYAVGANVWQTLETVTGAQESTTIAENALPPGRLSWRVRTYNTDDIAGEWSDAAAFICERAPDAPTITGITQCSRPTISWQVIGQIAYQLQFDELDTKEVAGTTKSYKLKEYQPNGAHAIKLRVLGSTGLWSQWTEVTLTLSAPIPDTPTLTAEAITSGGKLTFVGGVKSYLLRDDVPIANVTGLTEYIDYMALGEAIYTLRAVDANDNYADSVPAGVIVTVPYTVIAAVDTPSQLVSLKYTRGEPRVIDGNLEKMATYRYYAGRKKPITVFAGQDSERYAISVAYTKETEKADLKNLVDREKTVLYRDAWGNRNFVTIASLGMSHDSIATSIEVNMTVTDYTERVEYEV